MSWGGSEFFSFNGTESRSETHYDFYFTTPSGHAGVTFIASAGDSGFASGVEWPSVSPNVLSVGGTSLQPGTDGTYTESSWTGNQGQVGTNGGYSVIEPTPVYQSGVNPDTNRSVPDVAYVADPNTGVAVFDSYQPDRTSASWEVVGGTSVGAPQWAALIAIADQGRALLGQSTLDGPTQTLPMLYSLYSDPGTIGYSTYTSFFNDVIDSDPTLASAGYDLLTGLGSPKAVNLVDALAGITPGSQSTAPMNPPAVTLPPSTIEATIVSTLPGFAVGSTAGSMTLRLFNTTLDAFSGPVSVALYATPDGSISSTDTPFAIVTLKKVAIAGETAKLVVVHFRYPTSLPNGSYQFAAAVTATEAGTAPAKTVASNAVTIVAPVIDLSAKPLLSKIVVRRGHRKLIALRITNNGNFVASGDLMVNLYASTDQTLDLSDPFIRGITKAIRLLPGHSMLMKLGFRAPSSLTPGSYNVIAAASSTTRPPDVNSNDKVVVIATRG